MSVIVRRTPAETRAYFEGCLTAYRHMLGHEGTDENLARLRAFVEITEGQLTQFNRTPHEGPMKIYVASSWRNNFLEQAFAEFARLKHEAYDFRKEAFSWRDVYPHCNTDESWAAGAMQAALAHPTAQAGFARDMDALRSSDAVLLVLPSGRSSHLEAGWAAAAGKRVAVWAPGGCKPELMYALTRGVHMSVEAAVTALAAP